LEIDRFVAERSPEWRRLERLLDEVEGCPDRELGLERIQDVVHLYRQACSDLNKARSYTANPAVLDRLNELTGRGYRFVYRRQPRGLTRDAVATFFRRDVPRTFRRQRRAVLAAAGAMTLGALVGFGAVVADPARAPDLVPQELFTASPRQRVERLEKEKERIESVEDAADFASHLYTHNIQVSFLAFSLGAVSIVGGVWILFYNGVILGAIAALYMLEGVHVFFLAWVGPHGALEIPAIVFSGAAGLVAGRALLAPGERKAASAIRAALGDVWHMMLASACVLVVAGVIEGSFSQLTSKTIAYPVKIAVAGALFTALLAYLFVGRPESDEAAL
jgi:uncharacterized membrane protein SpoIIM required for sporulation